ncbi:hypothetical protein L0128_19430 [candidate division KSB1 bacterium]|nr:hypothetical protein [candidate division KSB1 bacterium]
MIYQIYEQQLTAAFERLLQSIDSATQWALNSRIAQDLSDTPAPHQGIGVELQGQVLFFQTQLLARLKQALIETPHGNSANA